MPKKPLSTLNESDLRAEFKATTSKVKTGVFTKPQGQAIKSLIRRLLEIQKLRRDWANLSAEGGKSKVLDEFFRI